MFSEAPESELANSISSSDNLTRRAPHSTSNPSPRARSPLLKPGLPECALLLTDRQLDVSCPIAEGLTNGEIGQRLGISLDGTKYHVSQLLTRLNLERRDEITAWVHATSGHSRRLRRGDRGGLARTGAADDR